MFKNFTHDGINNAKKPSLLARSPHTTVGINFAESIFSEYVWHGTIDT